jgi:hypothetical protein
VRVVTNFFRKIPLLGAWLFTAGWLGVSLPAAANSDMPSLDPSGWQPLQAVFGGKAKPEPVAVPQTSPTIEEPAPSVAAAPVKIRPTFLPRPTVPSPVPVRTVTPEKPKLKEDPVRPILSTSAPKPEKAIGKNTDAALQADQETLAALGQAVRDLGLEDRLKYLVPGQAVVQNADPQAKTIR